MGIKQVVTDDLTDAHLPDGTKPTKVTFDGKDYEVYLSDESKETLHALFNGEAPILKATASAPTARKRAGSAKSADKERNTNVREWAKASGFKYKNAAGEEVTLGDRGVIPEVVYAAYDKAH